MSTTTTTTDLTQASAAELQLMHRRASGGTIACLPAQVLYVAAQFASRDEAKQVLQLISVRRCGADQITIESCDGHRAFRFRLPAGEHWYSERDQLLVSAAAFRKRVTYGHWALISDGGVADVLGGRMGKGAKVPPAELIEARPWKSAADCLQYPQLDQLWPDQFSNKPGGPVAWNASYLGQFLAEVSRYSHNGAVRMVCNSPTKPLVFSSSCELPGVKGCELEYLLMPVQIRK
jgi:hypothetical protein